MALERRALGGDIHAVASRDLEAVGMLAAFIERTGGVSPAPFDTLNGSLVTDDDPANGRENRRRVIKGLGIPAFATAYQAHGAAVSWVDESCRGAGFDDPETRIPRADGLVTKARRLPVAVLTADCLPVILGAPAEGTVAAVHAGWRGLAAGILRRAAALFPDPREVRAVIGPGIGPDHYEVSEGVVRAVGSGCGVDAVVSTRGRSLFLDLAATARVALREVGIRRVDVAEACTACEPGRFFSHRRDGRSGRQLAIAMVL